MKGVKTFEHFPSELTCPVCKTNSDEESVILEIDGTEDGGNCEAKVVHLRCAIARRFNREHGGLLYTRVPA